MRSGSESGSSSGDAAEAHTAATSLYKRLQNVARNLDEEVDDLFAEAQHFKDKGGDYYIVPDESPRRFNPESGQLEEDDDDLDAVDSDGVVDDSWSAVKRLKLVHERLERLRTVDRTKVMAQLETAFEAAGGHHAFQQTGMDLDKRLKELESDEQHFAERRDTVDDEVDDYEQESFRLLNMFYISLHQYTRDGRTKRYALQAKRKQLAEGKKEEEMHDTLVGIDSAIDRLRVAEATMQKNIDMALNGGGTIQPSDLLEVLAAQNERIQDLQWDIKRFQKKSALLNIAARSVNGRELVTDPAVKSIVEETRAIVAARRFQEMQSTVDNRVTDPAETAKLQAKYGMVTTRVEQLRVELDGLEAKWQEHLDRKAEDEGERPEEDKPSVESELAKLCDENRLLHEQNAQYHDLAASLRGPVDQILWNKGTLMATVKDAVETIYMERLPEPSPVVTETVEAVTEEPANPMEAAAARGAAALEAVKEAAAETAISNQTLQAEVKLLEARMHEQQRNLKEMAVATAKARKAGERWAAELPELPESTYERLQEIERLVSLKEDVHVRVEELRVHQLELQDEVDTASKTLRRREEGLTGDPMDHQRPETQMEHELFNLRRMKECEEVAYAEPQVAQEDVLRDTEEDQGVASPSSRGAEESSGVVSPDPSAGEVVPPAEEDGPEDADETPAPAPGPARPPPIEVPARRPPVRHAATSRLEAVVVADERSPVPMLRRGASSGVPTRAASPLLTPAPLAGRSAERSQSRKFTAGAVAEIGVLGQLPQSDEEEEDPLAGLCPRARAYMGVTPTDLSTYDNDRAKDEEKKAKVTALTRELDQLTSKCGALREWIGDCESMIRQMVVESGLKTEEEVQSVDPVMLMAPNLDGTLPEAVVLRCGLRQRQLELQEMKSQLNHHRRRRENLRQAAFESKTTLTTSATNLEAIAQERQALEEAASQSPARGADGGAAAPATPKALGRTPTGSFEAAGAGEVAGVAPPKASDKTPSGSFEAGRTGPRVLGRTATGSFEAGRPLGARTPKTPSGSTDFASYEMPRPA